MQKGKVMEPDLKIEVSAFKHIKTDEFTARIKNLLKEKFGYKEEEISVKQWDETMDGEEFTGKKQIEFICIKQDQETK